MKYVHRAGAALVVALLLTGCGGHRRLSHAELVARVNTLCLAAIDQATAVPAPSPSNLNRLDLYLVHLRRVQVHFLGEVRKLRPPVSDEHLWRQALAYNEKVVTVLDQLHAAALRRDKQALRRGYARLQKFARNPYERRLGVTAC